MAGSPDPFQLPLQCGVCRLPDHLRPFGVDARLIPVEKHPVSQYPRPSGDAEGLSNNAAIRANEAIRPAASLKVGGARRIIGKQPLEFGESLGKGKSARCSTSVNFGENTFIPDRHFQHAAGMSLDFLEINISSGYVRLPDRQESIYLRMGLFAHLDGR